MINKEDFKLTGEFKVSICGPDNLFFIGRDIFDFITKSTDGIHWIPIEDHESILCKKGENFKFNELLLKLVDKCNIPLKIYLNKENNICIKYDEKEGNSNLIKQFNEI